MTSPTDHSSENVSSRKSSAEAASSAEQPQQFNKVTLDRVVKAMKDLGIELDTSNSDQRPVGFANINGIAMLFAAMPSVLLVRGDVATSSPSLDLEPSYFLAANQLNAQSELAKVCIMDKTQTLTIRAEAETMSAAGLSDIQLTNVLKHSVDTVLGLQEAFGKIHATIKAD